MWTSEEGVLQVFFAEKKQEKNQNRGLSRSAAKEMFLVFEMSPEVEAIIVPKDSQFVVVKNSNTEDVFWFCLCIDAEFDDAM